MKNDNKRFLEEKKAQCHTDSVFHLLMLLDGRIATSSLDHSIIIYSKSTLTPKQILKSHTTGVTWIDQLANENCSPAPMTSRSRFGALREEGSSASTRSARHIKICFFL